MSLEVRPTERTGAPPRETLVVVGNGMVGQKVLNLLTEADVEGRYRLVAFAEEARAAYDRVNLSTYFGSRDAGVDNSSAPPRCTHR